MKKFDRRLICPWCQKGLTLADGKAKVSISVMCPKCRRYYIADLDTLKTEKASALKKIGA